MSFWKDYAYVDAHYEDPITKKRERWIRLRVEDVEKRIVEKAHRTNCYATVQRFKEPTSLLQQSRELEERATAIKKSNGHDKEMAARLARESEADDLPQRQLHYHGLFFDFDCDFRKKGISEKKALGRSRDDAVKLVKWFSLNFNLNPAHIQVWFTGCKGFHVVIRPEPFGIRPHAHLTYIVRNLAYELSDLLEMETMDRSVYTIPRMWRIPNSIHPTTGRFKIELSCHELINWELDKILAMSRAPRTDYQKKHAIPFSHVWDPDEYDKVDPDSDGVPFWQERFDHYDAYHDLQIGRPRRGITVPEGGGNKFPVCIQDLLENGPKEGGPNRNRILVTIAGFLRDSGMDRRLAHETVEAWTRKFYPEQRWIKSRVANGRSVVDSAYRSGLHFSCRFVRSLKGQGPEGIIECETEEKCRWIRDPTDMDLDHVPLLHLADASKGCYIGTQVKIPIHVAAVAGRRYELPVKGVIVCHPDLESKKCQGCPKVLENGGNDRPWSFDATKRRVLNLVGVNDNIRKSTIRGSVGIPHDCYKNRIEVQEDGNLEELQVIPMVDHAQAGLLAKAEEDSAPRRGPRHAVERAFFMGHGIEANKKYIIEATVFGHPKDQSICFLFDKAEPAQNDIDQFDMTPELYQELLAFQPRGDQTVKAKLQEIHRDLTANVHRIGGRFDLSIAVDLCYHSVIGFMFAGDPVHKGWWELLVMGDTGTGKLNDVNTLALTPTGWTKMGSLEVGDEVIGKNGKPTKVLGVYPQGVKDLYRVTFRDGGSVLAGAEHLWSVSTVHWERSGNPWKVKTTQELIEAGLRQNPSGAKGNPKGRRKFWIPTVSPVSFKEPMEAAPVDPWVLGVLLGDGSLAQGSPTIANPEKDLTFRVAANLPKGDELVLQPNPTRCDQYRIVGTKTRDILKDLGLYGHLANSKFVPARYLWGTIEERLAVLQGLCDTDGHVDKRGKLIDYITVSKQLAYDVVFLVRSLGGLATISEKVPTYTYKGETFEGQLAYRIGIHFDNDIVPVTTEKHLARWKGKSSHYLRTIESIELEKQDEAVCIKVAAADGLYVVEDFIVSHNTTMIERMMTHYGLGELIAGEDSKRTGLIYASVQLQGQWILLWGKMPQNDRRLLVIDEFAGIPQEEVGKLTQIRSEGKARGGGVNQSYETWARTRLIMLTNPRENEGNLEEFGYGIQAVRRIFKELQDLRRVDFAVTAAQGDVPKSMITKRWDRLELPHRYTSSLCKALLLWVWSREPHHVAWAEGTEDEVIKWSNRLGDTYECNIPLAIRADLRIKLARISVSVAARLFSTDGDAKKVIVKKEHVQFSAQMMDHAYRKGSMSYFEYARVWKQDNHFTAGRKQSIRNMIESFDEAPNIIAKLLATDMLSKPMLTDMLNLEAEDMKRLWKYMVGESLLRRTTKGYRRSPAFTTFLKVLKAEGCAPKGGDLGEDFETGGDFEADKDPFDGSDEVFADRDDADIDEPPF